MLKAESHVHMLADPQSVTVNAVAQSLPAINREKLSSTYRKDDGSYTLIISHQEGKRNRRVVRLENRMISTDPLTDANAEFSMSAYLVVDVPPVGYSLTEQEDIVQGLVDWLTSANIVKVLGGQS